MSYLERSKGLPYGSIPYEEILSKLEETDMSMSTEPEINYNNYIRSELVDYSLDKPFLEYDTIKRDGTTSKIALNLRYNGSRGSYDYPKHPDLFIGFMDADPRGVENLPRMDQYKEQINKRMPNLEIRMGHNSDQHECERPWTNQSLNNCRRDLQTSLKYNTKVFIDELNGRALNNNINVNYDHNKPQLIYKDLLPNSITSEHNNSRQNTGYTVSSVPFVKNSTYFAGSYDNTSYRQSAPTDNKTGRNIQTGHIIDNAYDNASTNKQANNVLRQESKLNNSNTGHVFTENFDDNTNRSTNYQIDTSGKNTQNELYPNTLTNVGQTNIRTDRPSRVNNNMSENNVNEYVFTDMDVRRHDSMRYSNANTFVETNMYPHLVSTESENKRNTGIKGDNNILLINSSIIVPDHSFNNIERGRHYALNDTNKIVRRQDINMPTTFQIDHTNKQNNYKFTDNISNVNTNSYVEPLRENTAEAMNRMSRLQGEVKMSNLEYDNNWANSDVNTIAKGNRPTRTSGTDDQVSIDIPNYNDFNTSNSGSRLGTKSIRGDHSVNSDTFSGIEAF